MSTKLTNLVDRQVHAWQQRQKAKQQRERTLLAQNLTVSRQYGARGHALAEAIAQRLGYTLWDQELVHELAEETGASETILKTLDEHYRGRVDDAVQGLVLGSQYTSSTYLKRMMKLIMTIASHGHNVFVGRGAEFVLPESVLKLRVVCPLQHRIERYMTAHGLSEEAATKRLLERDRDRQSFVRQHYNRDTTDPQYYDLTLNTGWLTMEQLSEVAVTAYRAKVGAP